MHYQGYSQRFINNYHTWEANKVMECRSDYFMVEVVNQNVKITQFVYFPAPPHDFLLPEESVCSDWNQTCKFSKIINHQIGLS